jgi:hypothetical protein
VPNQVPEQTLKLKAYANGRLNGLEQNRFSYWTHWRELANFYLPRRYKWLVTPNQWNRGASFNGHIIDNTGTRAARDLAAGITTGVSNPTRPWFDFKIGQIDTTQTSPISLWLRECVRILRMIYHESNFYPAIAQFWADLALFNTAVMIIYEDFENVINCYNPAAGEYYLDLDAQLRPRIFARKFVRTIDQIVGEFGYENCSENVRAAFDIPDGSGKTREIIIAHLIEPLTDRNTWGLPDTFEYGEVYWEWGGSQGLQAGGPPADTGFLRKKGFHECCVLAVRWDVLGNDAYGKGPSMDALGDVKQLQQESRKKAQAIDKMVSPPLVGDAQLKNQPASQIPGGITYISGFTQNGKGLQSLYETKFPIAEITEDLVEVRERIKDTFYNQIFKVISQYETRSNVTAVEIDARRAEALLMLGPVLTRMDQDGLRIAIDRTFAIAARAGILPDPPPEIAGLPIQIDYKSMLALAQEATEAAGIERTLGLAGNMAGVLGPEVMDGIDGDYALEKYSKLMNNDPKLIRSPEQRDQIRSNRQQQQQQAQQVAMAEQLAQGAKTLSETDMGGGQSALQGLVGGGSGPI